MNVLKKKQSQSSNGFLYAYNDKGKSIKLLAIPQAQTGSSVASPSTIRKRSQLVEKLTSSICSPVKATEDLTAQQASAIKRNKERYLKSAEMAGINIISRFSLKQVKMTSDYQPPPVTI